MTALSVNINKIATLRNSRGGNNPKRSQARTAANTFGLFPPRELRRVAILLMFTDNAVMLISIF